MARYDPSIVEKNRYHIVEVYINDLKELRSGRVPQFIESHAAMLEAALPYFSEQEREYYEAAITAGENQARFLSSKDNAERLRSSEAARMKTIDQFCEFVEQHPPQQ